MKIIQNHFLTERIDHGAIITHRKKRIAKKWDKAFGHIIEIRPMMTKAIFIPGKDLIICHPEMLKELEKALSIHDETINHNHFFSNNFRAIYNLGGC